MNCSHCRALTLCAISLALITGPSVQLYASLPADLPHIEPPDHSPGPPVQNLTLAIATPVSTSTLKVANAARSPA